MAGGMYVTTLGVVMAESAWLSGQCTRAESRAPALFDMRIELVVVRRCRGVRCSTSVTLVCPQPVLRLVVGGCRGLALTCYWKARRRTSSYGQARGRPLNQTSADNETTKGLGVHGSRARATTNPAASTHTNELNTHDELGRGPGLHPGTLSR